jgi:hypothetical protein
VLRRDCDGNWTPVDLVRAGVIPARNVRSYEDGALQVVASAAPDDVWIEDGNGKLLHFDGASWSTEMPPARGGLMAVGKGELYLGTSTGLFHRTTTGWESISLFSQRRIVETLASAPNDVWVLSGDSSSQILLHHFDGMAWSLARTLFGFDSIIMAGSGPNDVWLAGSGQLQHFDGSSWTSVPTPMTDFYHVASGGAGKLWAEGASGDLLFDGRNWTNYPGSARLPSGMYHTVLSHVGHAVFAISFAGEILSRQDP